MPIEAIVAAGAASAGALNAIIPHLNGARSVVIEVDNNTDSTLTRFRDNHDHGGFAVTPSSAIPPHHADIYGSQSKSFSVGTGTEGDVGYHAGATEVSIDWDDPFIGDNHAHGSISGDNLAPFRIVVTTGAGNEHAHMRYEVFDRAQDAWRFCDKCVAMFFDGFPAKGVCPRGGGHHAAGFVFVLPHDTPEPGQPDWRFCEKCNVMFFDGFDSKGVCAAGGEHHHAGFNFVLPHDRPGPGQPDWRFCDKCNSMFFDGSPDKGACPAGGGHVTNPQSFRFVLDHRPG